MIPSPQHQPPEPVRVAVEAVVYGSKGRRKTMEGECARGACSQCLLDHPVRVPASVCSSDAAIAHTFSLALAPTQQTRTCAWTMRRVMSSALSSHRSGYARHGFTHTQHTHESSVSCVPPHHQDLRVCVYGIMDGHGGVNVANLVAVCGRACVDVPAPRW
jgi:hypothetical protein